MTPEQKNHIMQKVEDRLQHLPWYVGEFINYRIDASPNTLDTYTRDYKCFFEWLVAEGFSPGPAKEVSIHVLDNLRVQDIINFQRFCLVRLHNKVDTVARKLASLKSLFHYLSQIAEDEEMYPYLHRNVMAKIDIRKEHITESKRAERIASRILIDDEIHDFREFIRETYGERLQEQGLKRKYKAYLRNRERDLALISLLLGSGLRISEALSIDIDKIDWRENQTEVVRKGDSLDIATFSNIAAEDMKAYLSIRESRYKPEKNQKAFFLSYPTNNGISQRLTVRAAQKMFEKYARAYGKSTLSLHKLRHSFATKHYQENKDIAILQRILNHASVDTTMIYTHVFDEAIKKSINRADR